MVGTNNSLQTQRFSETLTPAQGGALLLPDYTRGSNDVVALLALGFARGEAWCARRCPYARRGGRMKASSRANVASSFTVVKGAMIDETYAVFAAWDFARSKRENLDRLREENFIGASSTTWLRDVAKVLNRRFDPDGRDRALVVLGEERLRPRRVEAAPALAHDARRVPRAGLPRRTGCSPPTTRARSAFAPRSCTRTFRASASEAPRPSTRGPSRRQIASPRACSRWPSTSGSCVAASSRSSPRTTCPSAASSTYCTRCGTRS